MKASFICFLAVLFNREVNYFFQLLIFPSGDWFSSKVVRNPPQTIIFLTRYFFCKFWNWTGQSNEAGKCYRQSSHKKYQNIVSELWFLLTLFKKSVRKPSVKQIYPSVLNVQASCIQGHMYSCTVLLKAICPLTGSLFIFITLPCFRLSNKRCY